MEYRRLGRSGVKVSTLCLGTMTFGEVDEKSMMYEVGCDEPTSFRIMNAALEGCINFIDTADIYGPDGLSERVIGKWFAEEGRRNDVVLATKCRFRMAEGPLGTGASRRRIMRACEESLKRLQTDRIDLYQIHMQDVETPEEETLRALDDLVRQGKVLYIGASNYTAYRLVESLWVSDGRNLERYVTLQMRYNLVSRELEREHVPPCLRHGLGILPWSPLAGGLLTGKFGPDRTPPAGARLTRWQERYATLATERNWRILEALESVAKGAGAEPSAVALAWLLKKPAVTSVIFGARSLEQLESNLEAARLELSDEAMGRLDEASAEPFGYPYEFMAQVQGGW